MCVYVSSGGILGAPCGALGVPFCLFLIAFFCIELHAAVGRPALETRAVRADWITFNPTPSKPGPTWSRPGLVSGLGVDWPYLPFYRPD